MIKAVTFDLWQTLIYETLEQEIKKRNRRVEQITNLLAGAGYQTGPEAVARAHEQVWMKCREIWSKDIDFPIRTQILFLLEFIDSKFTAEPLPEPFLDEIIEAYVSPVFMELPYLTDGVPEILQSLTERGIKIGLISNTGRTPGRYLRDVLQKLQIGRYFITMSFSDELLIRKPSPEIFYQTLGKIGVTPQESIHIGDDPQADITGAKRVGMKTVWLKNNNFSLEELPPADIIVEQLEGLSQRLLNMV
ncbi:MAG: HAD family hydrolase [Planctomycetota bacterium]